MRLNGQLKPKTNATQPSGVNACASVAAARTTSVPSPTPAPTIQEGAGYSIIDFALMITGYPREEVFQVAGENLANEVGKRLEATIANLHCRCPSWRSIKKFFLWSAILSEAYQNDEFFMLICDAADQMIERKELREHWEREWLVLLLLNASGFELSQWEIAEETFIFPPQIGPPINFFIAPLVQAPRAPTCAV